MKRITLAALLSLVFLASSISTPASLLEADDAHFGLKSLTIDTTSGLAWLDLTFSLNYSYLQAEAATGIGGDFAGFRHATTDEVLSLFQHAGIADTGMYPASDPAIQSLASKVGPTTAEAGYPEAVGISGTLMSPGSRWVPKLDFLLAGGSPVYNVSLNGLAYGETTAFPTVGNWLVMTVPEPSAAGMVALGGAILAGFLRRKRVVGDW